MNAETLEACAAKVERYDWSSPGDKGRSAMVKVEELEVDTTYQRPEISEANTLNTARNFSWAAFGALVVMERDDGHKFIVDGRQRWAAAMRRGIAEVPCRLFRSEGRDHEAQAFCWLNTNRTAVRTFIKFMARATAKQEPEAAILGWLRTIGFEVGNGNTHNVISFPDLLLRTWKQNEEAARTAVMAQIEVIGPEQTLNNNIHHALFYLARVGIDIVPFTSKLQRMGGKDELLRRIRVMKIEMAKEGGRCSDRLLAATVLEAVNFKRRGGKLTLPDARG